MNTSSTAPTSIIIGAGPAGLAAALELLERQAGPVIVLEESGEIGGLSRTVNHHGNHMDLGGHRFFTKSKRVSDWWHRHCSMEKRNRLSRIFYHHHFFDYPVSLSWNTFRGLGLFTMAHIGVRYLWAQLFPIRPERTLEDFFINRFGKALYLTFFKDYTEKVWGLRCHEIGPEWGTQRVKGLSLWKTLLHAILKSPRQTETTLSDHFFYPPYGPGQLWKNLADRINALGGEIRLNSKVVSVHYNGSRVNRVTVLSHGKAEVLSADFIFSSMPISHLVPSMLSDHSPSPLHIAAQSVAEKLLHRDFIVVGVLVKRLLIACPDNWIYVQEPGLKLGRIQIYNNWGPLLVHDPQTTWLGLEFFCSKGDALASRPDSELSALAIDELGQMGLANRADVLDTHIVRVPLAYPIYHGAFDHFDTVRRWLDSIENLYPMGRNGMHRYNNMDHSILSAMMAVDAALSHKTDKHEIWNVNPEDEYLESK